MTVSTNNKLTGEGLSYLYDIYGNVIGVSGVTGTTWSLKPLASAYIGTAFITDIGGGTYWVSNGTRWRPLNGRCLYSDIATDITSGTIPSVAGVASSTVVMNIAFPANFWQNGDTLGLRCKITKGGGTTDTLINPIFISSNTSLGTNLISGAAQVKLPDLAATTINSTFYLRLQRVSSTSVRFISSSLGASENTTSTNGFLITGLPSMDSAFNLQICSYKTAGASPETITVIQAQVDIESVLGV